MNRAKVLESIDLLIDLVAKCGGPGGTPGPCPTGKKPPKKPAGKPAITGAMRDAAKLDLAKREQARLALEERIRSGPKPPPIDREQLARRAREHRRRERRGEEN